MTLPGDPWEISGPRNVVSTLGIATLNIRRKVHIAQTSKGWSVDATVEMDGPHTREELLADLKALVTLVEAVYLPQVNDKDRP